MTIEYKPKFKRKVWTSQEDEYLRKNYADSDTDAICKYFSVKRSQVYSRAQKLGLNKSKEKMQQILVSNGKKTANSESFRKNRFPKGYINNGRRKWTQQEDKLLIQLYPKNSVELIAEKINRTVSAIYQRAKHLKLNKDKQYLQELNERLGKELAAKQLGCRFKKGQKPWNEGIKGYMTANKTSFKKGNVPANHKPIGTVRRAKDCYEIKVAEPNVWISRHKYAWLQAGKKVPRGHVVVLKDGNHENLDISNLECICRGNLLRRNSKRQELPDELSSAILAINKVNNFINNNQKQNENE